MDDWWDPPSSGSSWHRIYGDGQPSDYSAGASSLGDWRGDPEPIPEAFIQAFPAPPNPEAHRPSDWLLENVDSARINRPRPPIDAITGVRSWIAAAIFSSKLRLEKLEEKDK